MIQLTIKKRTDYDYRLGTKVVFINNGIHRKAEDKNIGPYLITEVFSNGTVRIQRGTISERINIRRLKPYFELFKSNVPQSAISREQRYLALEIKINNTFNTKFLL